MGYQGNYPPSTPLNPTQLGTGVVTTDAIANGAVNPVDLSTGGPYWDTSGNVGIGTTSPGALLELSAANAAVYSAIRLTNTTGTGTTPGAAIEWARAGTVKASIQANTFGNDYMAFCVNGNTERMRIDTSGNVGIGTSSPSQKLDVVGNLNVGSTIFTGTGVSTGDVAFELGGNRSGSGNSYIDFHSTSGTDYEARIIRNGGTNGGLTISNTGTGGFSIQNDGAAQIGFNINGSERARIDSLGNLLVGTSSWIWTSNEKMSLLCGARDGLAISTSAANLLLMKTAFSNQYYVAFGNSSATVLGSITGNGSTVAYNTSSDYRLKENVQPMYDALETVSQLNPVKYTWKADGSNGEGFLAHELQAIIPQAVNGEKDAIDADGKIIPQGVDYSKIVVHLVAAIQELKAELDALKGTK